MSSMGIFIGLLDQPKDYLFLMKVAQETCLVSKNSTYSSLNEGSPRDLSRFNKSDQRDMPRFIVRRSKEVLATLTNSAQAKPK